MSMSVREGSSALSDLSKKVCLHRHVDELAVHYQDYSLVHLLSLNSGWHILVNIQCITVRALAR
jgi:hypothetical protein